MRQSWLHQLLWTWENYGTFLKFSFLLSEDCCKELRSPLKLAQSLQHRDRNRWYPILIALPLITDTSFTLLGPQLLIYKMKMALLTSWGGCYSWRLKVVMCLKVVGKLQSSVRIMLSLYSFLWKFTEPQVWCNSCENRCSNIMLPVE